MLCSNLNILFVCSRNQWRSPTGEAIWRKVDGVSARSAGTARSARRQVRLDDIEWADVIFCMEHDHKARLRADFRGALAQTEVIVLDIPDSFQYMETSLVEMLIDATEPVVFARLNRA